MVDEGGSNRGEKRSWGWFLEQTARLDESTVQRGRARGLEIFVARSKAPHGPLPRSRCAIDRAQSDFLPLRCNSCSSIGSDVESTGRPRRRYRNAAKRRRRPGDHPHRSTRSAPFVYICTTSIYIAFKSGSGKSTILRHVLKTKSRVAVIMNEFAQSASIEGRVMLSSPSAKHHLKACDRQGAHRGE